MKCDELKRKYSDITGPYYGYNEVNDAIAELKEKLESLKATHDTEMMDAGMRERRLRRALWIARANRAICEIDYWRKFLEHVGDYFDVRTGQDLDVKRCEKMIGNWIDAKIKCLKKAEEYK